MSFSEKIPVIELEGNYYQYRRLGIDDVTEMLEFAAQFVTTGYERLQFRVAFLRELLTDNTLVDEEGKLRDDAIKQYMGMLVLAFGASELKDRFRKFVTSALYKYNIEEKKRTKERVSEEELSDPDLFPAYSLPFLLLFIVLHPDFELIKTAVTEGLKIPFFGSVSETVSDEASEAVLETLEKMNQSPEK